MTDENDYPTKEGRMNKEVVDPMTVPYWGWWDCPECGRKHQELYRFWWGDEGTKPLKLQLECGHVQDCL